MIRKPTNKKVARKIRSPVNPKHGAIVRRRSAQTSLLLRRVMAKRRNKPIKIMFVCMHGLSTSVISKEWFIDFLEHKKMNKYFTFSINDEHFSSTNTSNSNPDYIVPILPGIKPGPTDFVTPSQRRLLRFINSGRSVVLYNNPLQYLNGKGTLKETQSRFLRQILLMEQKRLH